MQQWLRPPKIAQIVGIIAFYAITIPIFDQYVLRHRAEAEALTTANFDPLPLKQTSASTEYSKFSTRATNYMYSGEYVAAIANYKTALHYDASNSQDWGGLGWSQYVIGQTKDSIISSRRAVELDARATYARYNIGLAYATLNDAENARKAYKDAMAINDPESLAAAITDVQDALKKHPHSETLRLALHWLDTPIEKWHEKAR